jgi:hypothetical protein
VPTPHNGRDESSERSDDRCDPWLRLRVPACCLARPAVDPKSVGFGPVIERRGPNRGKDIFKPEAFVLDSDAVEPLLLAADVLLGERAGLAFEGLVDEGLCPLRRSLVLVSATTEQVLFA